MALGGAVTVTVKSAEPPSELSGIGNIPDAGATKAVQPGVEAVTAAFTILRGETEILVARKFNVMA